MRRQTIKDVFPDLYEYFNKLDTDFLRKIVNDEFKNPLNTTFGVYNVSEVAVILVILKKRGRKKK